MSEPGYRELPTGLTCRQKWDAEDTAGRRALMTGAGFRLMVMKRRRALGPVKGAHVHMSDSELPADLGVSPAVAEVIGDLVQALDPGKHDIALSFVLDPDLAPRAGLAAQGRPVRAPDTTELMDKALAPMRRRRVKAVG